MLVGCCCWVLMLLCSASANTNSTDANTNSSLQLVHVLFRHGARTPIDLYANDTNAGHFWSGLGQLTNEGKVMAYELGRQLRRRYSGFLQEKYNLNYTRVVSSDVDRTLMSAELVLAGLYPPPPPQQWTPDLGWQPIPVHTQPEHTDLLLRFINACPPYMDLRRALPTLPYVAELDAKYSALYSYLSARCGRTITTVKDISWLYDTLSIEDTHGLPIPEWARARLSQYDAPVYPQLLRPLNDLAFQLMGLTQPLRRLGGGLVLSQITSQMEEKVAGRLEPPSRELFIYSGHDFNVATLLAALGAYDGIAPPPSSCVILELHRDAGGDFFVQLLYRNDSTVSPYELTVPGCARQCPWRQFLTLTAPVRTSDAADACAGRPSPSGGGGGAALAAEVAAAVLLLLLLLVAGVAAWRSRRRAEQVRYSALDTDSTPESTTD